MTDPTDPSAEFYRALGLDLVARPADALLGASRTDIVIPSSRIELLAPADPFGGAAAALGRDGPGPIRLAIAVASIEDVSRDLESRGIRTLRPAHRTLALAEAHPASEGLIFVAQSMEGDA
jgi:hypothetical protein